MHIIAWNLAFTIRVVPTNKALKILLSSVVCTSSSSLNGDVFITARTISLSLALLETNDIPVEAYNLLGIDSEKLDDIKSFLNSEEYAADALHIERYPLVDTMGESNLYSSLLPSPSNGEVEEMLYMLCGNTCHDGSWKITDTAPIALLDDEQFQVYFGFVLWATVLLAGLGFELLFWMMVTTQGGWSDQRETRWWLAQFVFPLCAATCLGLAAMRNFMALPFLVFGLFKFGMPETISYMYIALHDTSDSAIRQLLEFRRYCSSPLLGHHSHHDVVSCWSIPCRSTRVELIADLAYTALVRTDQICQFLVLHYD